MPLLTGLLADRLQQPSDGVWLAVGRLPAPAVRAVISSSALARSDGGLKFASSIMLTARASCRPLRMSGPAATRPCFAALPAAPASSGHPPTPPRCEERTIIDAHALEMSSQGCA